MRIPEVIKGDRGSNGIAFLFKVTPLSFSKIPASLPVNSSSTLLVSTRTMWFSVPPLITLKPCS